MLGCAASRASEGEDPSIEMTVFSASPAEQLRRSAYVVTVIETEAEQREGADLGEVLARRSPVTVRRASGLGSRTNLALGGLGGERLRFFVDGVPLELMGYLAGPANVPVSLVDRVDVYQGAVPLRLTGDALGGAVDLVTDDRADRPELSASYQLGSFGTQRLTLSARAVHRDSGLFARADGFYDVAANDYDVDVETFDSVGRIQEVTVPRFHGAYRGRGLNVGVGLADRPAAERLVLQGYLTDASNELQHGVGMARPYGEVQFDRVGAGLNLLWKADLGPSSRIEAVAGYAHLHAAFQDLSSCLYDWYGRCTPRANETVRGEISGTPADRTLDSSTGFLRALFQQRLSPSHRLRLAVASTVAQRTGRDHTRAEQNDALAPTRHLRTAVGGVELESSSRDQRVSNVLSVKAYLLQTESKALLATGEWSDLQTTLPRLGGGDTVRLKLGPGLYAKAAYELATRQPSLDELYGDGQLVLENLTLRPETSHNSNLGLDVEDQITRLGGFRGGVQGFLRLSDDLIAQLSRDQYLQNVNVWRARALGVDSRLGWTDPGGHVLLDGRATWQDVRNVSDEGDLVEQAGDRIPNTPFLFGSASLRLRTGGAVVPEDQFELALRGRYVHPFLLGWESYATEADRLTVPAQLTLGLAAVYALPGERRRFSVAFGVENLTDADTYDFYAVQRPGRSYYARWTVHSIPRG